MSVVVSTELFRTLFPRNAEPAAWALALNAVLPKYGITTGLRVAAFLAQCGHESEGFSVLVENLNYSAEALTKTWPSRFPAAVAEMYARRPMMIANRAYANRMGNGPEESGDGWKHRGRGLIQLTGGDMYRLFAKAVGKPYKTISAYLETTEGAVESACWFWTKVKDLNPAADAADIVGMTKRINGGTNGLADRTARYARARALLQV
jgi:putative chitinase